MKKELIKLQCDSIGCRAISYVEVNDYIRQEYPNYENMEHYTCPICDFLIFDRSTVRMVEVIK